MVAQHPIGVGDHAQTGERGEGEAIAVAAVLALVIGATASPLAAQDLAGQWLFSVDLDAGSGQATFTFEVDGSAITGTYGGILGEHAVTGTIEGDFVTFGFESIEAGGAVSFEGVIDGDAIEGTCVYGGAGSGTFSGSKVE